MYYINTKTAPVHALWSSVVLFLRLKLAQRGADNWQSNIRKRNVQSLCFLFADIYFLLWAKRNEYCFMFMQLRLVPNPRNLINLPHLDPQLSL